MDKLLIKWSKKEKDFVVHYPAKCDGSFISELIKPWKMVHPTGLVDMDGSPWERSGYKKVSAYVGALGSYSLLEMDWVKELDRRGYDTKTLKFEIKRKTTAR